MQDHIAPIWKVEAILNLIKETALPRFRVPGFADFSSKTFRFASKLGFTRLDIYNATRSLTYLDYVQGPLADNKGRPSDLWVFGSYIESYETYIKLVACIRNGSCETVCVSFHEAERPLSYPHRKVA